MKRILPAGERYAQNSLVKVLCFLPTFLVLIFSCSTFQSLQTNNILAPEFKGVYDIGDKLPKNFIIGHDISDSNNILKISDLNGKSIIIDAWATWCGACISKFPFMDSLQKDYKNELKVILLNVEDQVQSEKVRDFVKEYNKKYPDFELNFFIQSSNSLNKFFTFRNLPHYIWIDGNRRVQAFTNYEALTNENLQRLFGGLPIHIPMKLK